MYYAIARFHCGLPWHVAAEVAEWHVLNPMSFDDELQASISVWNVVSQDRRADGESLPRTGSAGDLVP
jgi:hypothetical protein